MTWSTVGTTTGERLGFCHAKEEVADGLVGGEKGLGHFLKFKILEGLISKLLTVRDRYITVFHCRMGL